LEFYLSLESLDLTGVKRPKILRNRGKFVYKGYRLPNISSLCQVEGILNCGAWILDEQLQRVRAFDNMCKITQPTSRSYGLDLILAANWTNKLEELLLVLFAVLKPISYFRRALSKISKALRIIVFRFPHILLEKLIVFNSFFNLCNGNLEINSNVLYRHQ